GEIVLGGDLLHQIVGDPMLQRHHRRGISLEHPAGKSVYLIKFQLHGHETLKPKEPRESRRHRMAAMLGAAMRGRQPWPFAASRKRGPRSGAPAREKLRISATIPQAWQALPATCGPG